ncbi:MAG: glycosyltransferase family 39 protein [Chloroflexi bacterium]|nr:glycosyltransferase family 39 protein [Chloroflexota bacterium]MCI0576892.1 glycosyltransferase family 39 protein [Chloroflexota bacterium]MCI0646454.1 glycosyltransferase family 39 protein [Chloroflexota bacterium]MCI0729925.1 glycosyltransferase family 39 protein [Chloroflexota bacterium]
MIRDGKYKEQLPLNGLLFLVALGFMLLYLYVGISRVRYPYSLDLIEDNLVMQAWRVMQNEPDYVPPNAEYVPQVYMPLYGWIGGLIFKVTGPGFGPLRAFSFLATLATAGLIYWIAARESANRLVAFGCAGLFLAGYRLVGGWYELARVENLFVLLTLAGITLAIYDQKSARGLALSGALLGLSLLTKQNGLIFAAGTGVYLLLNVRWRVWVFAVAFVLAGLAPMWLANLASDGWLYTYVFGVAYASPIDRIRIVQTLQREIFGAMLLLTLSVFVVLLSAFGRLGVKGFVIQTLSKRPWPIFIAVAVLVTIATRASVGGARQNYIVGYAFLCLAPALLAAEMAHWRESWRRPGSAVLPAVVILQFLLAWSPAVHYRLQIASSSEFVPTAAMWASGDRLIERIAGVDGPVFVMMHPPYALMAGKAPSVHIQSLWHARFRGRDPLPADLVSRIENHYYAMIISDGSMDFETDPALVALLDRYYTLLGLLPPTEGPPTLSGPIYRPQFVYVPR